MSGFQAAEGRWIERLGNLRNVIRQELISRQLSEYVRPDMTVLDVGCGQGTQALSLAARGCRVTGVDPSGDLLELLATDAREAGLSLELIEDGLDGLGSRLAGGTFDLVCAHGVLMYLDDRTAAITELAARLAPRGRLSLTFRNGHALAMRPGLRRDWAGAIAAFDTRSYVNELGVSATADRLEEVEGDLQASGLRIVGWFGVRIFNDAIPAEMPPPEGREELTQLLEAEDRAGRLDPYRWMASQLHVIAERIEPPRSDPTGQEGYPDSRQSGPRAVLRGAHIR